MMDDLIEETWDTGSIFASGVEGEGGSVKRLKLRCGMEIVIADDRFREKMQADNSGDSALQLFFRLEGSFCSTHAENERAMGICVQEQTLLVEIKLDSKLFEEYAEVHPEFDYFQFANWVKPADAGLHREELQPAERMLLAQIVQCDYPPPIKKIFVESKVLELLSIYFLRYMADSSCDRKASVLRADDKDKIELARELLLQHLEQPPSLLEMARMVGLNDYKLKAGFKEVFGMTVFGYLREKRLEKALDLLEQGALNVGEVACAIGYSNPSHFTAAFKRKYGINPGKLLQSNKSQGS